jgi:hypothetical protein
MSLPALIVFAAVPVWVIDLGVTDGDFVSGGETGQWGWGVPSTGPTAYGTLWGTNLSGNYLHDTTDWLEVPLPDLSGVAEPTLLLEHWYAVRPGDSALVELDGVVVEPAGGYPDALGFVGTSGAMVEHVWDLEGQGDSPTVRLLFAADAAQADAGWFLKTVSVWDGDLVVPTIVGVTEPQDTQLLDVPYLVEVDVTDDRELSAVNLWIDDGSALSVLPMAGDGARYSAFIPAEPPGTTISWWVEASDGENTALYPPDSVRSFRVYLAAPTGLVATPPEGRPVATSVELDWQPPDTPHPVLGYQVRREDVLIPVATVEGPPVEIGLEGDAPQRFFVTATYEEGAGDPSEILELDIEVPALQLVEPEVAYQGEELYVRLQGQSLYLLQSEATLALGPDIEVLTLEVRDANTATARVRVSESAAPGPVDLVLGEFVFEDRFVVRDGADAPHIARLEPASLLQAETLLVEIESTELFAAIPSIGTDDELLVTSAVSVEGKVARFELTAAPRATPGPHTLSIDDGERLYTVDIEVTEVRAQVGGGCGCNQTAPLQGITALSLLLCLRRPRAAPGAPAARGR